MVTVVWKAHAASDRRHATPTTEESTPTMRVCDVSPAFTRQLRIETHTKWRIDHVEAATSLPDCSVVDVTRWIRRLMTNEGLKDELRISR